MIREMWSTEPRRDEEERTSRRFVLYKIGFVCFAVLRLFVVPNAQEAGKTVADGVYSDAQAARGASAYETSCAGCHRADLGGGTGPALKEQRFARQFADKDLRTLFARIATTMPRNAPGSLGDAVSLDIVAHLLKENGFPPGASELSANALDGIRVLPGRPKPPPPVGDFSYVEVVGCLTADAHRAWLLTKASAPVSVSATASSPRTVPETLGGETYHLVDALAYAPQTHLGYKLYVRGLLIRLPGEQRITISALEPLSSRCAE
jgi:mono/diheme cytochrome c family protein